MPNKDMHRLFEWMREVLTTPRHGKPVENEHIISQCPRIMEKFLQTKRNSQKSCGKGEDVFQQILVDGWDTV